MATGTGLLMMLAHGIEMVVIFVAAVILLVLVFRVAGAIKFRQILEGLKKRQNTIQLKKLELESYEQVELHFRQAKTFETWWHAICFAADKMEFTQANLPLTNRDGSKRILQWEKSHKNQDRNETVETVLCISDRRSDSNLRLGIDVNTNGSVASAGRRIALFSRLIEKYSVAALTGKK
jgi:hypothetical protein